MQEPAPTEGGLLTADETAVNIKGAWRYVSYLFTASVLLYKQRGEYMDRPLIADDVPRGRYRALVVASLGCGAVRVVRPRGVAGDHTAKGTQRSSNHAG